MSALNFNKTLTKTDPQQHPVLIVGQLRHLSILKFEHVQCKLSPRVSEEIFQHAITCLHPSPTDCISLYLDLATIAALPIKCSRHNTSSRSHAITRLVKTHTMNVTETILIVCDKKDVFASACAVARAYPLYSRKSRNNNNDNGHGDQIIVNIEFILIENDTIVTGDSLSEADIECLSATCDGIRLAAKIVDMPCNEMNVSNFINEIETIASHLSNVKLTIIRGEELNEKGIGGIYGVGKASTNPPALAVLSYEPIGGTETYAWVGKGIVYDTGGLSIKQKTSMPGMKRDCGGAAAILGAFQSIVKVNFAQNLHAVFCLAENSVGPNSTRPDDIHELYSGRTVEINNTDAEGRLVLADGVAYAKKDLKATTILDMATLTGAQGMATGKYHGAILTNNEDWESKAIEAGRSSGDLLAPLVYCPELHFSEFASSVADMKNSVANRNNAQSSCAGLFIAANLGFDFPGSWIHIDMTSPAYCGERATGYGVALLCSLFGGYTDSALLKSIAPKA